MSSGEDFGIGTGYRPEELGERQTKVDVLFIGMGGVGGIAGPILAQRGLKVLGLEAGPWRTTSDFSYLRDELRGVWYAGRNEYGRKWRDERPTWRRREGAATVRSYGLPSNNGVGGSTLTYVATSFRFRPHDMRLRSHVLENFGEEALPQGSNVVDWPVSYEELEPYYEKVERAIGVAGQTGNLRGEILPEGNPYEAARESAFPLPPLRPSGLKELFSEATTRLGLHPFPPPSAIATVDYDGRPACTYCHWCGGYPCHNGAKGSTLVTTIPKGVQTGNMEIRPFSTVVRINVDEHGRATGVDYLDGNRNLRTQPAELVVLAAYCYENARLLLLSAGGRFPAGLANNGGLVGSWYMTHMNFGVTGFYDDIGLNRFTGPLAQGMRVDDFNHAGFDTWRHGFITGTSMGVAAQLEPIFASGVVPPGTKKWGSEYKQALVTYYNRFFSLGVGGGTEVLPYDANRLDLDPHFRDSLGRRVTRVTFDVYDNEQKKYEHMISRMEEVVREMGAKHISQSPLRVTAFGTHDEGGTRFGDDPGSSVCDEWGRTWEIPNLFIMGGSLFPTMSSYNPTLTMQALAWRQAEYIADRWGTGDPI